jgi:hypothetical protein
MADYPRMLRPKERELLESVLPPERPGYDRYRALIGEMQVIGEGRRGKGNLVLGRAGDVPDITSPLGPVVAYGVVETTRDPFTVTVREYAGDQIDVEIVSAHGEEIPDHFEEKRRWTYSGWNPGDPSPATGSPVREVRVDASCTLAIAVPEKRIWIHDRASGMVHLLPVTNFTNALMLHKRIRDPKVALRSAFLFENLRSTTDADLRAAFVAYNAFRHRVTVSAPAEDGPRSGFWSVVKSIFRAKD